MVRNSDETTPYFAPVRGRQLHCKKGKGNYRIVLIIQHKVKNAVQSECHKYNLRLEDGTSDKS
uniref:Si660001f06 n=1 Tax=Arundo donax TaxID=35708 RepID=A0A0A9DIQ8_ARUDO